MLLWQCPHCHVDDALAHKTPWFKPEEVRCTRCGTTWEVQRIIGNDYLLTVTSGEPSLVGHQRPLVEWYNFMKAGVRLVARHDPSLPLEPGEELYLRSEKARLLVEADNPLHDRWGPVEAPWEQKGDLILSHLTTWDTGRLALTGDRLVWAGKRRALTFRLRKVNSVHADLTRFLGVLYGLRQYKFCLYRESNLKWLTYTALAAQRVEEVHGHRITFSNY